MAFSLTMGKELSYNKSETGAAEFRGAFLEQ